jgi:uncharacterized damage-inducible protein DinB
LRDLSMIGVGYVQRMARYNRWQNENLYGVADALSSEERRHAGRDRPAGAAGVITVSPRSSAACG